MRGVTKHSQCVNEELTNMICSENSYQTSVGDAANLLI